MSRTPPKATYDVDVAPVAITDIMPTHFITVHQSAIRALAWVRAPPASPTGEIRNDLDPTIIASGGYDGTQCLTDIRQATGYTINRTRGLLRPPLIYCYDARIDDQSA